MHRLFRIFLLMAVPFLCAHRPLLASTLLRFDTSLGDVDVRLYDTATPASVANFLNYVNDDDFDGSFFHRAPKTLFGTFVVQGGGFTFDAETGLGNVPTDPAVVNEPGISNLKYTVAYAKLGSDPNSATSGFFFNTQDNSGNLDNQNGGFTVFGRLVGGFDVLDAIADLNIFDLDGNFQSTFDTVPLQNSVDSLEDTLVFTNDVQVLTNPAGDYNFDGIVDAADYTVWRDTLGSTLLAEADGNGNGIVDAADYLVWKNSFGQTSAGTGTLIQATVPEPATALLALLAGVAASAARRLSRRNLR